MTPAPSMKSWRLVRLLAYREPEVPPDPPQGPDRATAAAVTSASFSDDGRSAAIGLMLRPPKNDDLLAPHVEAEAVADFEFDGPAPEADRAALVEAMAGLLGTEARSFLAEIRALEAPPGLAKDRPCVGSSTMRSMAWLESLEPFEIDFSAGKTGRGRKRAKEVHLRLMGSGALSGDSSSADMEYRLIATGSKAKPFELEARALARFTLDYIGTSAAGRKEELTAITGGLATLTFIVLVNRLLTRAGLGELEWPDSGGFPLPDHSILL